MADGGLDKVCSWLRKNAEPGRVGLAIRAAIDDVLEGSRDGKPREYICQLEKTEKTFIGTRVEMRLLEALKLLKNPLKMMDTEICGEPVDVKCTVGKSWMVPEEAKEQLCLLVQVTDDLFHLGVVRATPFPVLSVSQNKDGKHTLKANCAEIQWIHKTMLPHSLIKRRIVLVLDEATATALRARFGPAWILDPVLVESMSKLMGSKEASAADLAARDSLLKHIQITVLKG